MAEKKFETALARLEEAERKVEVLLKDKAGNLTAKPFDEEAGE